MRVLFNLSVFVYTRLDETAVSCLMVWLVFAKMNMNHKNVYFPKRKSTDIFMQQAQYCRQQLTQNYTKLGTYITQKPAAYIYLGLLELDDEEDLTAVMVAVIFSVVLRDRRGVDQSAGATTT